MGMLFLLRRFACAKEVVWMRAVEKRHEPRALLRKTPAVAAMHWSKSACAVGGGWVAMGSTNGERQIEIAGRGAGVIEDAPAD